MLARIDIDAGLRRLGYPDFRPGQREAVEILLRERRLLLVAPTGGGKSLVYQLPASVLPGTTLVLSPLISLMQDQVRALESRGVRASYLASTLEVRELHERMARLARGDLQLVYVAPERLSDPGFRSILRGLDCALVAIDEAHCISEWGHDFRPEYLRIGELLAEMHEARVLACTATATPIVRDEILERLGLEVSTPQLVRGFARPNLSLRAREVRGRREREAGVDEALREALGAPGSARGAAIVYGPTRRSTEEESTRLERPGWRVLPYHAGLAPAERELAQQAFSSGEAEVIVATNAFGMGIDRADVRAVIHLAPPASLEAYYQEVGRAGRDGAPALGLLMISPGDMALRRRLLELNTHEGPKNPEVLRHRWSLFLELMRWAEGGSCRHDAILRYFGDEEETLAGCGRCDVCRALAEAEEPLAAEEIEKIVRRALSAVARVHGRFGLGAAVRLLRGTDDPRLRWAGLERTPTFGALRGHSEDWLTRLLRRCITAGWIELHGTERPVVALSEEGLRTMRGERPARLLLPATRTSPRAERVQRSKGTRTASPRTMAPASDALDEMARKLFESLRRYRLERARREGVPPYVIASDRTLREIAQARPQTLTELEHVHGIGPVKAERYGRELLSVVRQG